MQKISPPPEDVEGLIQQLNSMSLDDPKYGLLYYRAVKNDSSGLITQCIRRPPKTEKTPGIIQRNFAQPSRSPHTSATYPNNIPTQQFNNSQRPRSNRCYGCFEETHVISECPKLAKLMARGIIQKNQQNRKYFLSDGRPIYRRSEESLIEVIEKLTGTSFKQTQVNFVTLASGVSEFWAERNENENEDLDWPDTDDDDDGPYWRYGQPAAIKGEYPNYNVYNNGPEPEEELDDSEEYTYEVYPAERGNKQTTEKRKDVMRGPIKTRFDRVHVPERPRTRSSDQSLKILKSNHGNITTISRTADLRRMPMYPLFWNQSQLMYENQDLMHSMMFLWEIRKVPEEKNWNKLKRDPRFLKKPLTITTSPALDHDNLN